MTVFADAFALIATADHHYEQAGFRAAFK